MPAVDLFPDIKSVKALQQALFSYPPNEIEKYDLASRQLILSTLIAKAEAVSHKLPDYYYSTHTHPELIDAYQAKIGYVPMSLLDQVNEAWAGNFETLEQYYEFISVYKKANIQSSYIAPQQDAQEAAVVDPVQY